MSSSADQLTNVLLSEAKVTDELLQAIEQKQEALICFRSEDLGIAVERERSLLKQMRALEQERQRIVAGLVADLPDFKGRPEAVSLTEIGSKIDGVAGKRLLELAGRIKASGALVQQKNQQNRLLLDSSARFVKNTLRILTDDHSRQIVDRTI